MILRYWRSVPSDAHVEPQDFVLIHESDLERLLTAIRGAHQSLTKSSLIPEERVSDATLALSRVLDLIGGVGP